MKISELRVCVLGLGYVGLPLAIAFGKSGVRASGFDLNPKRILELNEGFDKNNEIEKETIRDSKVTFFSTPEVLKTSNFIIVCVPTPVDPHNKPDLSNLDFACKIIGGGLKKGTYVVFESTVYPGATEEFCVPIIERQSGLKAGKDFYYGYSPERINPGDKVHTLEKVVKVVSGMNDDVADFILNTYSLICKAGVYKAQSVRVAEAAKVIENTQRDLNIALINELSVIFHKIGINTKDVLDAASTKWNFIRFNPGLVGGHCVGVDPYYLIEKSISLGYNPKVIGAGREINDKMSGFVVKLAAGGLRKVGKRISKAKVLILGLTFKENVSDLRNSKVFDIINKLNQKGSKVFVYDPIIKKDDLKDLSFNFVSSLNELPKFDVVILAVSHKVILEKINPETLRILMGDKSVLVDVKSVIDREEVEKLGIVYYCL